MVDLKGLRILIVEDEPIIALDLASMVQEAGGKVIGPAMTLADAEALSGDRTISVALLDVRLGSETVTPVAAKLAERGVALLFHTAHGSVEALVSRWAGAKVLSKPARPDVLIETIAALAGQG
jgi:DNA-binding response OmpR family regulator